MSYKKSIYGILLLLQGCLGGENYAPIIERKERVKLVPKVHIVKPGETLYSIAWRYSMDARGLANTNGIGAPYTIFPGQKINLKPAALANKKRDRQSASTRRYVTTKHKRQHANSEKSPGTLAAHHNTAKQRASSDALRWQWPARGKLIRAFRSADGVHKGIDIKGKLGESVQAAARGKVVYAGSGLVGYGKLLIIKHDEYYLSAYGHNRTLLVAEGELVKGGQQIAETGDTGTDEVKLHFEIRHNGKPVDPLKLLPRK